VSWKGKKMMPIKPEDDPMSITLPVDEIEAPDVPGAPEAPAMVCDGVLSPLGIVDRRE
jgi:hypothetical protein